MRVDGALMDWEVEATACKDRESTKASGMKFGSSTTKITYKIGLSNDSCSLNQIFNKLPLAADIQEGIVILQNI